MTRSIAHIDLDTFFVSCERLVNPSLNGIPLIIGGGDRGVVASCSYEARKFGVHSAMPIRQALWLCPEARVVRGDMERYSRLSQTVTEIIEDKAPVVERSSIDEFYLDLTGMDRFFGCYKFIYELVEKVTRETGLPLSFALSVNKTVAKIGTNEAKPVGRLEIPEEKVKPFLNPLSVKKIPMTGEVTFRDLSRMGLRLVRDVAETSPELMQQLLGKNGLDLWKKANGIDTSPVEPYRERRSISTERTFHQDTIDIQFLRAVLCAMVEKLAFQLRAEGWLASTVAVKIRYANFDTHPRQRRIAFTSCDDILRKHVLELFESNYERRMRIRLVGVRFSGLVRGKYQIDLFEDTQEMVALYNALDRIKRKYGHRAASRGAWMQYETD